MSRPLILRRRRGHDRGQGRALRRASCARCRGSARQGQPPSAARAGSSRTARRCSTPWSRRSPRCSTTPRGGRRLRARPPGRVGAGLGRRDGRAADPDRRLAGQALAGGARPPRRPRGGGQGRERASLRPLLLRRQARLAARERRRGRASARRGHAAHGHGRLVPVRPPRRRLRHRSLDRVADPAAAHRHGRLGPGLCETFGVPLDVLPEMRDTAGELGTLSHPSWPVELRALRPDRGPAGGARGRRAVPCPGRVKATYGTGVFVLAHVGDEVPRAGRAACSPRSPGGSTGRMEYALDGGVFAAGAMLEWMCRELGLARRSRRRSASSRGAPTTRRAPACCRRWPGSARPGGARTRGRCLPGSTAAPRARRSPARRSRGSPGGSPTSSPRSARRSTSRACASTAGSPTSRWCSQLQADAIGVPVEAAGADATVLGAAALAAVGSGVIASLAEAAELLPVDRTVEPRRDAGWRAARA